MALDSEGDGDIAIVAVEGRFPRAPDTDAYWALIREGVCAVEDVDAETLSRAGVHADIFERDDYVRKTVRLDGLDLFSAEFFGYSHRQAAEIDPQHRLFLEACWTTLERCGCDPRRFPGAIGVFAGAGPNRYALARLNRLLEKRDWTQWTQETIDSEKDFLATRVSYKLDLTGPSLTVQTACSSSLVAVHLACRSLRQRDCDLAIAGGVNIVFPPGLGYRHAEGGIASRDGLCRPFDRAATGTIAGSGLGIVALKRHEDARHDGNAVLALVKGSAINNDGARKAGYTAPSMDGQSDVIELALNGIDPATVEMIEAHGTGTALGDAVELDSLVSIFGAARCALGSVKANIGHLDAASGVASLIKAVLCLQHREIPPQINFDSPNEHLQVGGTSIYVNRRLQSWRSGTHPRRAAVSSFGMGGTNAHVVLEEANDEPREATDASDQLFVLSAKTATELDRLRHALADQLGEDGEIRLHDVAYTLQVGRAVQQYRVGLVAHDINSLIEALHASRPAVVQSQRSRVPVVLVFSATPGLTNGVPGLLRTDLDFRARMRSAAASVQRRSGVDLLCALEGGHALTSERQSAALHLLASFVLARMLRDMGIQPLVTVGDGAGQAVATAINSGSVESSFADWLGKSLLEADAPGIAARPAWGVAGDGGEAPDLPKAGIALVFGTPSSIRAAGLADDKLPPRWSQHDVWDTLGNGGRAALLGLLGELWLSGADLTPQRHALPGKPRLVALATYPFERRRYWIGEAADPASRQVDIGRASVSGATDGTPRLTFHVPTWMPAPGVAPGLTAGSWVVFGDSGCIAEATLQRLRQQDASVIRVEPGHSFCKLSPLAYQIRSEVRDDYVRLWRGICKDGHVPDYIVQGTLLAVPQTVAVAPASAFLPLLHIVQSVVDVFGPSHPTIVVATRGLHAELGVGVSDAGPCVLTGLLKVITQELSMPTKLVDLPGTGDPWRGHPGGIRDDDHLFMEARDCTGTQVVAYRGGRRFVQGYQRLDPPAETYCGLRNHRTFLITGGLGLIGLALAEDLARRNAARLLLITRGPFPERVRWEHWLDTHDEADTVSRTVRRLLGIETSGAQIIVRVADIARQEELAEAVRIGERVLGRINGVFHLAADTRHRSIRQPILQMEADDFAAQARPKIDGFNALDHVLAAHELDVAVAFSSNASVVGGFGFAAYAAVNAYLDHAVVALSRSSRIRWRSINWDGWHDAAEDPQNPYSMPIEQGLEALRRVIGLAGVPQVIVATGDLAARLRTWVGQEESRRPPTVDAAAPRQAPATATSWSELEVCVWDIWRDVLGNDSIGLDQSFDDLGGDSLIAMRIVARLGDTIGFEVPLEAFIGQNITIASLCSEIGRIARRAMMETDRSVV